MATQNDSSTQKQSVVKSLEDDKLQFDIERLKEDCNEFSFLAVGKTGAGKSTLLNALTGTKEFDSTGDKGGPGTKSLSQYKFQQNNVTVTAWDSPGFEDCKGEEERYKKELKEHCSDVDLMLFCLSMEDPRATDLDVNDNTKSLKQTTQALGIDIWKRGVVVLTYANKVESRLKTDKNPNVESSFAENIQMWKQKIQDALIEAKVNEKTAKQIPIVPAGHFKRKHLPGRQYWLSFLWIVVLSVAKDERAKKALKKANQD